jgi:hypothetical protein
MQTRIHFGIRCCRLWWPPSVRKHELIVPLAIADSRTTRILWLTLVLAVIDEYMESRLHPLAASMGPDLQLE